MGATGHLALEKTIVRTGCTVEIGTVAGLTLIHHGVTTERLVAVRAASIRQDVAVAIALVTFFIDVQDAVPADARHERLSLLSAPRQSKRNRRHGQRNDKANQPAQNMHRQHLPLPPKRLSRDDSSRPEAIFNESCSCIHVAQRTTAKLVFDDRDFPATMSSILEPRSPGRPKATMNSESSLGPTHDDTNAPSIRRFRAVPRTGCCLAVNCLHIVQGRFNITAHGMTLVHSRPGRPAKSSDDPPALEEIHVRYRGLHRRAASQ